MLVAGDQPGDDHKDDQQPDERAEWLLRFDGRDHLADEERLREARGGPQDAQHDDDGEDALVLEQVGEQLAEPRTRSLVFHGSAETAALGWCVGHGSSSVRFGSDARQKRYLRPYFLLAARRNQRVGSQ